MRPTTAAPRPGPYAVAAAKFCSGKIKVVDAHGDPIAWMGGDEATARRFAASEDMERALQDLAVAVVQGHDTDLLVHAARLALAKSWGVDASLMDLRGMEVAARG